MLRYSKFFKSFVDVCVDGIINKSCWNKMIE